MSDPTIAAWSREGDLLFQLRQLREENKRLREDQQGVDAAATLEALAQPEPKYVAFMDVPYRKWVGLTTEEILGLQDFAYADDFEFVNHIEALLKEKNT